ncbi:Fe-S cluster assembly protein SufD [Lysobacter pythonis]|uniref:Fe-S cluster assembly protein SufD n=1 Tax=Solilutibacter pythonis TaxID=2483112 RepID=A0A3M2HUD0_9GAMM|nr:Fe-S cluster assembly protein SufD [Lysobacter pythonis]RMH91019.1 Fe-S cluster assembly protein SufD [Lysobacter pythonis]
MSVLLDSLLAGHDSPAAEAIREAGLPGARSEAWKYTPLRAFERRAFAPARAIGADAMRVAGIPAPRLVFVNGFFDAGLSDLDGLPAGIDIATDALAGETVEIPVRATPWQPAGDEVFANLNALLARQGARIEVSADTARPLHLVTLALADGEDRASHPHHSLRLAADAALTLVEHQLGDDHANLDNSRFTLTLGARARLTHLRLQDDGPRASRLLKTEARLAAGADYRRFDLELGAALSRHELDVRLEGEAATLVAAGVLLADGRRHLDTRLGIVHAARDTRGELPWRGLADGRARAVFHGGIHIEAGADGSEADLQNRSLLLSDNAGIDTQPVLVIHADEVKAAHGATVGQLDATALFYLRSRGIPEAAARRILTAAFVRDVLSMVEDATLRALAEARLDAALARMQSA